MGMLHDLPRGVPGRESDQQKLPSASFAHPESVAKSLACQFDGSKIWLGVVGGAVEKEVYQGGRTEYFVKGGTPIGIGDNRHVVLCAGSRAGKGRNCLIPTLLEYGGSVLVVDPKGELANITARKRKDMGQRICIVDPFGETAERLKPFRVGFNPMTLLRKDSEKIIEDAGLLADALVPAESHDPHWDDSARSLVEGLLLHVATHRLYQGRANLATVRDVLMRRLGAEGEKSKAFQEEMAENSDALERDGYPNVAEAIDAARSDFFERPDKERGSVLSTARRHLKFLDYPPLRASLSSHGFDLTDLKSAALGLTVYLCLPAGRMGTCARWFRLFVNMALEAMEREKTEPPLPVLAVLEEFHVLGTMRQLEVAAGMVAGFGMKLLIVLQDLTQLKRHYKEGWETFLGNAGLMIFFGNSDLTTLEFISKRCGQTSLIVDRDSAVTADQRAHTGVTGKSKAVEVRDLLTPEEASRFFGREDKQQRALIIRGGWPAMIVQRVKYDRYERFKGQWDKPR